MNTDEAHAIACTAFGSDHRIQELIAAYGDELYSSLISPSPETDGKYVELVLLGYGNAQFVDDPAGNAQVLARCIIDPISSKCEVLIEGPA